MRKPDSIIFDMDGTLWDGLNLYVESWNRSLKESNINRMVNRNEISSMAGWERKDVFAKILPDSDLALQEKVYEKVSNLTPLLLKESSGILYDGVKEGLEQLSTKYKLFIISNCEEGLIRHFMQWADIESYITDELAHGINLMPKSHNIKLMIEKHKLQNPIYVGDTMGDSEQSAQAEVPFVFLSHGFGVTEKYALRFDDFHEFIKHFINLE